MKLIVSHDVDVLQTSDHLRDLLMLKRVIRGGIECALGYATGREVLQRCSDILKNRLHRLPELIEFDRQHQVPSTFFFGMANGMYLNYSLEDAAYWMEKVRKAGLFVGVHGVEFENLSVILKELGTFRRITGQSQVGIRMHYLRMNDQTLRNLDQAGYVFDSSVEALKAPYKIGEMWEFPLHIMDVSIFCKGSRWVNRTFEQARGITLEMMEHAQNLKLPYFTINLHDPYYSLAYQHIFEWYRWLISYAERNGMECVDFMEAVRELEKPMIMNDI